MSSTLRKLYAVTLLLACVPFISHAQSAAKKEMQQLIDENMKFAAQQYKVLRDNTPADKMPRSFAKGKSITSNTGWWCSGFYPGALWYIYEYTKDEAIKAEAERRLVLQEKEKFQTDNHDIGFMIYCSFGTAYRITGNAHYKDVIDTAAKYQITRFRPIIPSIQSWNKSKELNCPVIIDNMMNLEQLLWVASKGGDKKYRDISIAHANTTMKNHYRPDHSTFHIVDYDLTDGHVIKKVNGQGWNDPSAWSRGQSWGLYGFTVMYRFTKNKTYLQHAKNAANFLLDHPNMPSDKIPYWDYNTPDSLKKYRDASAGSIMASALLELGQYCKGKEKAKYVDAATTMIKSLASPAYRANPGENGGFLLKHSVGFYLQNSEVDVPLTYADYYFIEALARYKQWYL